MAEIKNMSTTKLLALKCNLYLELLKLDNPSHSDANLMCELSKDSEIQKYLGRKV